MLSAIPVVIAFTSVHISIECMYDKGPVRNSAGPFLYMGQTINDLSEPATL
jgi:hypothetical protein